jgi:hypothetical protein
MCGSRQLFLWPHPTTHPPSSKHTHQFSRESQHRSTCGCICSTLVHHSSVYNIQHNSSPLAPVLSHMNPVKLSHKIPHIYVQVFPKVSSVHAFLPTFCVVSSRLCPTGHVHLNFPDLMKSSPHFQPPKLQNHPLTMKNVVFCLLLTTNAFHHDDEGDTAQKLRFLQEPHGVASQKTACFIVTTVKTSNLT